MSYASEFSQSQEYISFRSSIPQRKVAVDSDPTKVMSVFIGYLCLLFLLVVLMNETLTVFGVE